MTTDQEKLRKLFDAALRQTEPAANQPQSDNRTPAPASMPAAAPENPDTTPPPKPPATSNHQHDHVEPDNEELARLLDEQQLRKSRKSRRQTLVTAALLLAAALGTVGWFASNPLRVQALREAWQDIRTVSDARALAAKYQAALQRISTRSNHIDQATQALGIDPSQTVSENHLDAEMKDFTNGEATPAERAEFLKQRLGKLKQATGTNE